MFVPGASPGGGALLWTSREKDRNFVGRIVQGVSANAKVGRFGCNNWRGGMADLLAQGFNVVWLDQSHITSGERKDYLCQF